MPQFVFVQHQTIIDATKRVKKSGHSTIGPSLILSGEFSVGQAQSKLVKKIWIFPTGLEVHLEDMF